MEEEEEEEGKEEEEEEEKMMRLELDFGNEFCDLCMLS